MISWASQQLALGNGLASIVLAGLFVCCQAGNPELPSAQDLSQGVEVADILQGYKSHLVTIDDAHVNVLLCELGKLPPLVC